MSLRTAYDSVNADAIPTTAPIVMGYVPPSGYAWSAANWARFPNSLRVHITPSASVYGPGVHMLDQEPGDASVAQVPGWVTNSRNAGQEPTVYCDAADWGPVQAAINAAGIRHPAYFIAAYPGTGANLPNLNGITAIGHQYANSTTSGGDYDLSVVAPYWPGVDSMTNPLQANDPNFDQLVARVGALYLGLPTAGDGYGAAPNPTEPNTVLAALTGLAAQLTALTAKVDALAPTQLSAGPYYLTDVAPTA